jgi:ABC-type uncharacterized transport system substrate-binding protein
MVAAMIALRFRSLTAALGLTIAAALPAQSHPHVFIDAGLTFLFDDQNRLAAVQVIWVYDEFYSLLMIEDGGYDADGDGALTDAEKAALAGNDVDWKAGFPGDLTLTFGDETIALAGAVEHRAEYEDGRVVTSHVRPLETRIDIDGAGPLVAKVFDPTFFVAYDVTKGVTTARAGCSVAHSPADLDAANELVANMMSEQDYADDDYPEVGEVYADSFSLTCAAPS